MSSVDAIAREILKRLTLEDIQILIAILKEFIRTSNEAVRVLRSAQSITPGGYRSMTPEGIMAQILAQSMGIQPQASQQRISAVDEVEERELTEEEKRAMEEFLKKLRGE